MSAFEKPKSRSPLKQDPLRNSGQSVQDEIDRLLDRSVIPALLAAVLAVAFAAVDWWRSATDTKPQPLVTSVFAAVVVAYVVWHLVRARRKLKNLILGRDGEKTVGQFLDSTRPEGYRVLHDVPAKGFNVDHVLLGPAGLFAIETKTFSKPARGEAVADYDGKRLVVNGHEPGRNPVVQAKAEANWIRELLLETTGRKFKIQPVVLLPGWFVKSTEGAQSEVWVLNPKALPSFIENAPTVMSGEDVALVHSRLVDHITR